VLKGERRKEGASATMNQTTIRRAATRQKQAGNLLLGSFAGFDQRRIPPNVGGATSNGRKLSGL
jgi:hypothetical protein